MQNTAIFEPVIFKRAFTLVINKYVIATYVLFLQCRWMSRREKLFQKEVRTVDRISADFFCHKINHCQKMWMLVTNSLPFFLSNHSCLLSLTRLYPTHYHSFCLTIPVCCILPDSTQLIALLSVQPFLSAESHQTLPNSLPFFLSNHSCLLHFTRLYPTHYPSFCPTIPVCCILPDSTQLIALLSVQPFLSAAFYQTLPISLPFFLSNHSCLLYLTRLYPTHYPSFCPTIPVCCILPDSTQLITLLSVQPFLSAAFYQTLPNSLPFFLSNHSCLLYLTRLSA